MADITTSLDAAVKRAAAEVMDAVAIDGLIELKRTLDEAGLPRHENLKSYEIRSSVTSDGVHFEIVLDSDAIVGADERTRKYLKGEIEDRLDQIRTVYKTYVMTDRGPQKRDIRKTARDRAVERSIVIRGPRSMEVTSDGKLRVALERLVRSDEFGVTLPHGHSQGIMGDYEKKLVGMIGNKFIPKLQSMILERIR